MGDFTDPYIPTTYIESGIKRFIFKTKIFILEYFPKIGIYTLFTVFLYHTTREIIRKLFQLGMKFIFDKREKNKKKYVHLIS